MNDYIIQYRNKLKSIHQKVYHNNSTSKEKTINKLNENRKDPPEYQNNNPVYVKNKVRDKILPRFRKFSKIRNKCLHIKTNKNNVVHKKFVKPKRKFATNNNSD